MDSRHTVSEDPNLSLRGEWAAPARLGHTLKAFLYMLIRLNGIPNFQDLLLIDTLWFLS